MGKYLEMRSDGNQSINRVGASGMGRAGNANAADRGNGDDRPMTSFVVQRILSRNVDESMEKQKSINKQKKKKERKRDAILCRDSVHSVGRKLPQQ